MILHLVVDEKFIDMAYNMFERVSPKNNEFMVITHQEQFKYIKTTPITKISPDEFLDASFMEKLKEYDFLVLHWLVGYNLQILKFIPREVNVLWIGWGSDYYYLTKKNLLLPKTDKLKFRAGLQVALKAGIKSSVRVVADYFFNKKQKNNQEIEKIINRIDYFAPVLEEDYRLLSESFADFRPKYLDWNYGTLEDDFIRDSKNEISMNNILVGNSATYENNHVEAYDVLKKLNLGQRKIISPLSYGDLSYKDEVVSCGYKLFGDNFCPLVDFMDIDKYNGIVSSCSIVVMNHLRQQAIGNIISTMYFGAKIFLNIENPVYIFLKKNGAVIYSMEELNNESINGYMKKDDIELNRNVLRKFWSRDVVKNKTKNLIKEMKRQ